VNEMTVCDFTERKLVAAGGRRYQATAITVTTAAVCYNAILAIINSHGLPLSFGIVAAIELLILAIAAALIIIDGVRSSDYPSLILLYTSATLAVVVSLYSERIFVDGMRAVLIVGVFTMLGSRLTLRSLRSTFNICTLIALIVLLLEMFALPAYGSLFRPLDYFAATRGYPMPEWQVESGLSIGTGNYAGRFSIGLWNGPRTSTIFLEQTGINAFAIVLMVYLTAMVSRISKYERALLLITIILILLTNNARMATLMLFVFLGGYFLFPRVTNKAAIGLCVAAICITLLLFQMHAEERGDTLIGRLWVTYNYLVNTNITEFAFGNPARRYNAMDSGYGYLVASATLLGAAVYCVYIGFIIPDRSPDHRRLGWSLAFYLYLWLLVGGTSSSSIKTAALLWILVGYFVRLDLKKAAHLPTDKSPGVFGSGQSRYA
jgi:hypothetical protein